MELHREKWLCEKIPIKAKYLEYATLSAQISTFDILTGVSKERLGNHTVTILEYYNGNLYRMGYTYDFKTIEDAIRFKSRFKKYPKFLQRKISKGCKVFKAVKL